MGPGEGQPCTASRGRSRATASPFLLLATLLLFVVGLFMETFAAVIIHGPVRAPVALALGIDLRSSRESRPTSSPPRSAGRLRGRASRASRHTTRRPRPGWRRWPSRAPPSTSRIWGPVDRDPGMNS
ncbi:hypothetical protein DLJ49_14915 [Rhodovulum sp. 12E13]|uniref:TRAP transporter large permease subunit n=1 Tax=Rhodovulum sp. 12E13 TaxID=2203891 RepID=UPI000E167DD4|nr:hypothetical protein DLJ49_14915 [Rhodovulum sp. 12E13]